MHVMFFFPMEVCCGRFKIQTENPETPTFWKRRSGPWNLEIW